MKSFNKSSICNVLHQYHFATFTCLRLYIFVVLWNILYLPNNTVEKCNHLEFVYKSWNAMNSSKLHWNGKNNILKLWVLNVNARNEINALKWMKEHEKFYLLNTTTEWNSSLIVHLVEIGPVFSFWFLCENSVWNAWDCKEWTCNSLCAHFFLWSKDKECI